MAWNASPLHSEMLERFIPALRRLSRPIRLTSEVADTLTIEQEGPLRVVWAPFGFMRNGARVVLVGITPGRLQAERALSAFADAFAEGLGLEEAVERLKKTASFGGPLRANLVAMLDSIGLQEVLGLTTSADLFRNAGQNVHFTSVLHYPVFVNDANYSGTPDFLRIKMLRRWVNATLAEDTRRLPDSLWIPLRPKPAKALRYLADQGLIDPLKILDGMPHPSGANAERIAFFLGRKPRAALSVKTSPDRIEKARLGLCTRVKALLSSGISPEVPY